MASRAERLGLVSAAGWRLLLGAVLLAALVPLLATTRHLGSALLLSAALGLLLFDLVRVAANGRAAGPPPPALLPLDQARRLEHALALLDAVSVALLALSDDGRIRFANRAARMLVGADVARLGDVDALAGEAAARILALPVGGRQLVTLADGRTMLVWVGSFKTPDGGEQRLVSLQAVAGELDAVQVGAWHAMTRVLAHEMMNALTPIASLSESLVPLLETGGGAPEVAGAVDTIARQSRHLMRFVERYRAVVNLPEPQRAPLDPSAFLAGIAALVGEQMRARGIAFSIDADPASGTANADADLLAQALLNLLRNASDALAGVEGAEIRLSCRRSGDSLRFAVSDNGPGIPAERLDEIFVPFFTTKDGGAGIGLALSRQIALAHGGALEAVANPSRGMTFVLSIAA